MKKLRGQLVRDNDGKIDIFLEDVQKIVRIFWAKEENGEKQIIGEFFDTNKVTFLDPDPENRTFFILQNQESEVILAERVLPFKGLCNFRDLGGYETKDGRLVRWNLFYRSEDLGGLGGGDLEYFKKLGIKYVMDFRSEQEVQGRPDILVEGVENIHISAIRKFDKVQENLNMADLFKNIENLPEGLDPKKMLLDSYGEMVSNNEAFQKLMELIRQPENLPVLQHCSAGKDRTGVGSALILLALGVSEEAVIEDYLLSNKYRQRANEYLMEKFKNYIKSDKERALFNAMMGVEEGYIKLTLDTIKSKYSSYEKYFEKEFGLGEKELFELRNLYLI